MFDQEQYRPLRQFQLLSNRGVLATAHALVETGHPLTAQMLRGRCEHVRLRPERTLRSWLLALYDAALVQRVRKRGSWHYWAGQQLPELLRAARVSGATVRSPVRRLVPNSSMFKADGPETLEPDYQDPDAVGCEKIYSDGRRHPPIDVTNM